MTSSKNNIFDENAYRQDLERAGLSPDDAASMAAKTAAIRKQAFDDEAYRRRLTESGMSPDKVKGLVSAARRFHSSAEKPAEPPAAFEGFRAMSDIFGPPTTPAQAQPLPQVATPAPVLAVEAKTPAAPRKPSRATKKADELGSSGMVPMSAVFDYRNGEIPARVRDLIETHLAIEAQDVAASRKLTI